MEASEALELQDLEEGAKLRAALLERERLELVAVKKQVERGVVRVRVRVRVS